jgi:glycine/D-amino acid oxidase-like deaminating enzyme
VRLSHSFCLLPLTFCLVASACSTGTKVVTTTGKLVGKTATTAITTGGKVAGATVSGGATVAKTIVTTTGSVAGSIAKTAFVTVVDSATGTARQIPWTEGMKLYAATNASGANSALQAIQLLRGSQVIASTDTASLAVKNPGPLLQPGDFITLRQLAGR